MRSFQFLLFFPLNTFTRILIALTTTDIEINKVTGYIASQELIENLKTSINKQRFEDGLFKGVSDTNQ